MTTGIDAKYMLDAYIPKRLGSWYVKAGVHYFHIANDALLALLAKSWGVPRRDLAIVGGAKSRNKTVHVAGDPAELLKRLAALLSSLSAA